MRRTGLILVLLLVAGRAVAQQAEVRIGPGPYHVDVPVAIQVIADGFEASPEPAIHADPADRAELTLLGVSPNVSSRIEIINGQVTREESVRFIYRYQLLATQPGAVAVGPFRITQDGRSASARGLRIQIQEIASAEDQRFRLVLADGPFWVGQRIPVGLEWWLSEDFAQRLAGRRAKVPLFDRLDWFRFEDSAAPDARNSLAVDTATGTLELPVSVESGQWQGKPYLVVKGQRTLIALKAGEVTLEPASLVVEEAVRWSRDFFGKRVPSGVRTLRIRDKARTLVFRSPPAEGRPPSFAGAVGNGFSIQVSADRSVVQAGDPIRLTIQVRGDAALETVSLPRLSDSGLSTDDFKIPEGPSAGIIEDDSKRFEVMVRVNSEQVREVPPIELSWFNPDLGRYESTRSRPVALSVRTATRVSAEDVVTAVTGNEDPASQRSTAPAVGDSVAGSEAVRPAFSLSPAELAIEAREEVLTRDPVPGFARPAVLGTVYGAALASLWLGVAARRRAARDPAQRIRRQALEADRRAVSQANGAGELARALRRMAAASPRSLRQELDALLAECDNLAYAPDAGGDATVDGRLKARALVVADALLKGAR